jgi:hypothetical protein
VARQVESVLTHGKMSPGSGSRQSFAASRSKLPNAVKKTFSLASILFFNSNGSSSQARPAAASSSPRDVRTLQPPLLRSYRWQLVWPDRHSPARAPTGQSPRTSPRLTIKSRCLLFQTGISALKSK